MIRSDGLAWASSSASMRPDRLRGLGQVQGDEVRAGDEIVEPQQLDVELSGAILRDERVVRDQLHAERERPLCHELADPTQADDAERLVGELDAGPAGPLPAALLERCVRLGDVARLGQQERHRVLGRGQGVRLRSVDDHDATLGRGGDVDVVETDAGPTDDDQVSRQRAPRR